MSDMSLVYGTALTVFGAAFAAALPGIGSAKAVGAVGEAASGVIAEDPEKYGKLLILQALPGTQGIYGLVSFFLILWKSGILGGQGPVDLRLGFMFALASLPIALAGYYSAIAQGKTCEAGVALVAKDPDQQTKCLVMGAMVETYAILALLATLLLVFNIK